MPVVLTACVRVVLPVRQLVSSALWWTSQHPPVTCVVSNRPGVSDITDTRSVFPAADASALVNTAKRAACAQLPRRVIKVSGRLSSSDNVEDLGVMSESKSSFHFQKVCVCCQP